jgi:hypothetical protein
MADNIIKLIESTVDSFVEWEKEFTAYDITVYLRQEFPKCQFVHSYVRTIVHDRLHGDDTYCREFDENIGAFRYKPNPKPKKVDDQLLLKSVDKKLCDSKSQTTIHPQPLNTTLNPQWKVKSGYRNRINLSKDIVKSIGLVPGDRAYIYTKTLTLHNILISATEIPMDKYCCPMRSFGIYQVTDDNNLRIPNCANHNKYIVYSNGKSLELLGE